MPRRRLRHPGRSGCGRGLPRDEVQNFFFSSRASVLLRYSIPFLSPASVHVYGGRGCPCWAILGLAPRRLKGFTLWSVQPPRSVSLSLSLSLDPSLCPSLPPDLSLFLLILPSFLLSLVCLFVRLPMSDASFTCLLVLLVLLFPLLFLLFVTPWPPVLVG